MINFASTVYVFPNKNDDDMETRRFSCFWFIRNLYGLGGDNSVRNYVYAMFKQATIIIVCGVYKASGLVNECVINLLSHYGNFSVLTR